MAAQFCPYCGKPITAPDAPFCAYCARPLGMLSPQAPQPLPPGANPPGMVAVPLTNTPISGPPPVYGASPSAPASGPVYYPPPASGKPTAPNAPKSVGLAILLEVLISGTGAMYARKIGLGFAWLGASIVAVIAGTTIFMSLTQSAQDCLSSNTGFFSTSPPTGCLNGLYTFEIISGLLVIAWLVARCVLVANYVNAYNTQLGSVTGLTSTVATRARTGEFRFLKFAGRTLAMICGILGALFNLILDLAYFGVARTLDFAAYSYGSRLHGGWGAILCLLGFLGASIALPFPEVAAILMLIAGVGMFVIFPWYLALFGSALLLIGALLAFLDRNKASTRSA